ncbi:VENN motif pre-toxin domain-containing protein [Candidatus Paracaedibacter symbiosus]|uniref:VENN motif pre-toxin domain-containing protein n=1 Tax=Candidatus Paracaedibacter symbiosus TaxID=244582 RepID=UPI000A76B466|nr:VENN motif pre-toxin domain-containing protein [Candidatus Paracaedibacter symbiosus]
MADLTVDDAKDIRARVDEKASQQGVEFGSDDYQNLIRNEVQTTMNWSKLGAAVAVALAGHDVDVGVDVATNALENNFVPLIMGAVYVAGLAISAYDAMEAYEEDGIEGAVESVATDIAMGAAAGATVKVVGKVAKTAANAVKSTSIGQKAIEKGGELLKKGKEKVTSTFSSSKTEKLGRTLDGKLEPKGKGRLYETGSSSSSVEGKSSAKNVATHERYKTELRKEMERPYANDAELDNLLKKLHRDTATVGSGSTAAAVRSERATGLPIGGKSHTQKAKEGVVALGKWLGKKENSLPENRPLPGDRAAAENVIKDLLDSLQ